jgi:hypothetical protein
MNHSIGVVPAQALEAAKKDLRAKEAAAAAAAAEAEAAAGQREKLEQQQTQAQATVAGGGTVCREKHGYTIPTEVICQVINPAQTWHGHMTC